MSEARIVLSAVDKTGAGIAAAKAKLAGLGADADLLATRFGGLGAGIAGALTLGGFGAFFGQVVNGLDALNDLADATGSSIANLGGLEDVAARTGTSMETVGASLVKLNQVLNAAQPGSSQERALQAIGLSAQELRDSDPADALQQVAVALSSYADDGNKARLVQELFGRSVKEVAPLLKDLAENGFRSADSLEAQAAAAETFNKQLAAARKDAQDLGRAVVQALLPGIEAFAGAMKGAGDESERFTGVSAAVRVLFEALAITGANVAFVFGGVGREIGAITAQLGALSRMDLEGFNAISEAVKADGEAARKELEAFEARIRGTANAARDAGGGRGFVNPAGVSRPSVGQVGAAAGPGKATIDQYDSYIERLRDSLRATQDLSVAEQTRADIAAGKLGNLTAAQRDYALELAAVIDLSKQKPEFVGPEIDPADIRAFKELQDLIAGSKGSQTEALAGQAQRLGEAFNRGAFTADEYARGIQVVTDKLQALQPKLDETSEFAAQAGRNIQDALGDTVLASLEGNFSSIGKLWGDLIKRMVAQAAAAQLGKFLLGDNFAKTGEVGGAAGDLLGFLRGLGGARANGGPVMAGVPYLVGERGPEIVVPRSNGTVLPNGVGLGGGVTFQTIVQGDASPNTLRLIRAAQAQQEARMMRREF